MLFNLLKKLTLKIKRVKGITLYVAATVSFINVSAQNKVVPDSIKLLKPLELDSVTIHAGKGMNGVGRLNEVEDGVIYSGKKNVVLTIDSLNSNAAQSNMRETLGKVPGATFAEAQYGGFPYNGVGFRGFDATQSSNVNLRQNGYNITSDLYGHPESYYIPPMEAVKEMDIISGESSLQFGPQFGGVINYILKKGPADKPFQFTTSETGGSFGLINIFNSAGGTIGKWNYYAFIQYQSVQGWRPNSQEQSGVGFARLEYRANSNFNLSIEYTLQRNLIHMPAGLDDTLYNNNSDQSLRARNWISTPWNIVALNLEWKISGKSMLKFNSALNLSARNLVWRNDNVSPGTPDTIIPATNSYCVREVEHESFRSSTSELRFLSQYNIGNKSQALAAGIRFFDGLMIGEDRGPGSTGNNYDMNLYGSTWGRNLSFTTLNLAPFVENVFHIGNRISITPGFRYEYLASSVSGYYTNWDQLGTADSLQIPVNGKFTRTYAMGGIGLQYAIAKTFNIYGNISQTYNPLNYTNLYPQSTDTKIDPNLKDVTGYSADLGLRGMYKDFLDLDIGGFYVTYNGAVGLETLLDANGNPYTYETNIANAIHQGIETYIELNIMKMFTPYSRIGYLSIYNSFSYDNAKYVSGPFSGNYVENAPEFVNRLGITYAHKTFSTTFSIDNISSCYTDANNTVYSSNAEVGTIPAYQVMDWAAGMKIKNYCVKAGINNVANAKYFTMRVTEYPGPGIIPSLPRTFYVGFSATL